MRGHLSAASSDEDEPFPGDSSSDATSLSLAPFTKAAVNEVTFPVTSGHYYPVIMCCSAWLHLLFLADRLMLEKSNST